MLWEPEYSSLQVTSFLIVPHFGLRNDEERFVPQEGGICEPFPGYTWYLNFTNNYGFRPLNLLLIVVFILIVSASWNRKKGQWDEPHSISWFPCVRHPVAQEKLSLHCAIIGCFHSGELHDSDDCDQPVRVHGLSQSLCIPQVESVHQSCQDSCQSTFTYMQGLVIGSWGWGAGFRTPWQAGRHGRRIFGTSHMLFLGYPIYLL